MATVALISLYDEHCLGLRYLSSSLKQAGHDTVLISVKSLQELLERPGEESMEGEHCHDTLTLPSPIEGEGKAAAVAALGEGNVARAEGGYYGSPCAVTGREGEVLAGFLAELKPLLIGISLTSNFVGLAQWVARLLHAQLPQTPIVCGGVEPTVCPEVSLQFADYVCVGEGEEALVELANALAAGTDTDHIPNIWHRRGTEVFSNPPRPLLVNLDALPFPDLGLDNFYYVGENELLKVPHPPRSRLADSMMVITGRGCPYSCSYCCNHVLRKIYGSRNYVRRRSVANVLAELHALRRQLPQLQLIQFFDDVFVTDRQWLDEFCARYRAEIGLPFDALSHPRHCQPEAMRQLRDSGLYATQIGLQSGSERVLREVYNRPTSAADFLAAVRVLHDLGIDFIVDLIGSNPLETEADRRQTLDVLLAIPKPYLLHPVNALSYYEKYAIIEKTRAAGITLEAIPGQSKWSAPPNPEYVFWSNIFTLAALEGVTKEMLEPLLEDHYLREHPQLLTLLTGIAQQSNYCDGNLYVTKGMAISRLRDRLHRIEGSRLFQLLSALKRAAGRPWPPLDPLDKISLG